MNRCIKCGRSKKETILIDSMCTICRANKELLKKYGYEPKKLVPAGLAEYYMD